jgi:hypothetical protein
VSESTDIARIDHVPESLWERIRSQPERSPEFIALAAAERFGPQAGRWVQIAGGGKTPEQLAKIAYRKHVRMARLEGAALGVGGIFTAAPDLVALVWIQARMVFYVAAAYGYDPKHPMRPAEFLALQGVYPTAAEAREALDGAGKLMAQALVERSISGRDNRQIFTRLVRFAGKRAAQRYAGRLVPILAAPVGAVENAGATKDLGKRALAYYGGSQARP